MQKTEYNKIFNLIENLKKGQVIRECDIPEEEELKPLGKAIWDLGNLLENKYLEFKKMLTVTQQINSGVVFDEIMDYLYNNFRDLIPYNRIGVALLNDDNSILTARWAKSDAKNVYIHAGFSAPMKNSSLENIINTHQPRIINDLEKYHEEYPESKSTDLVLKEGVRSSLTCPLVGPNKPVGFIFFSSFQKNTYNDKHISIFLEIAAHISIIIEKGKLYSEIIEQKKRLQELNEVKNKFLGIAAHDLKNPLSVITGFSTILLDSWEELPKEEINTLLNDVLTSSNDMLKLIDDLLDVSKIESGTVQIEKQAVDIIPFVKTIVDRNTFITRRKNINIILKELEKSFYAFFDPNKITQVLNNLLTNASKFSLPGKDITVNIQQYNKKLIIEVIDQGPGIEEEYIPKLFEGFFTGQAKSTAGEKSTGLGLAICKKMVEAHNGKIEVKSKKGEGSTFSVVLPLEE